MIGMLQSYLFARNVDQTVTAPLGEADSVAHKKGRKIAIVEDERDMLSVYSIYLKRLGYNSVSTFGRGEEFLASLKVESAVIDLAIVDYRLPGLNGIETVRTALAVSPGLKIILTTADDSVLDQANLLGIRFLRKPFSLNALAGIIEES